MRSLCGMQTTGNHVTPEGVFALDALADELFASSSVFISGGPELNRRFQASRLPEE